MIFALLANLFTLLLFPLHALRRARAASRGAYVELVIDGAVVDLPRPRARTLLLRGAGKQPLSVTQLRTLTRELARDPKPAGLFVQIEALHAGAAVQASIRALLSELRAAGKDVIAYLPRGADNAMLYVASAARLVITGPETMVAPIGYAARGLYVRRALDNAGVEPEVFARGLYKSAGESLVRDSMSDAQREQLGALLEAMHGALASALAGGRRTSPEAAKRWIDEAPYRAEEAASLGIVDAVAYEDDLDRFLAPGGGRARRAPAARYVAARRATSLKPLGLRPVLGVIEVHGPIIERPNMPGLPAAAEEHIIAALRAAHANRAVKAVILHIDSPGGSALASNRIHHEVTRLGEDKPVVAYMSNVAASGGYYVAAGARVIIAQPQTVTGSIGVVTARFGVEKLLDRLGVVSDVVKRGARADLFSPARRLDEAERAVIEREMEAVYQTFLRVVAKGRGKPVEAIAKLAEGRIYSGVDAQSCGLVDALGGFDRALDVARSLLGPSGRGLEARLIRPPRIKPPPAPLPRVIQATLAALGLSDLLTTLQLRASLGEERVLTYWAGSEHLG